MNLTITRAETDPSRNTAFTSSGREVEKSTRMSSGTFETPYGEVEWDKYFTTNHTLKRREDFVVIQTHEVPEIGETLARINRAALLGERAIRQCDVVLGARVSSEAVACETEGGCVQKSTDMRFVAELPLAVNDLADVDELDIREDGEGLNWLRISNRHFDLYADNPAVADRQSRPTLGVFIPTETPGLPSADPEHMRWQYADALLTSSTEELSGALGDMSLREALLDLKPGVTSIAA